MERDSQASVLQVRYDNLTVQDALQQSLDLFNLPRKSAVFFLNLDCLQKSHKDPEYRTVLNNSALLLPDGVGLAIATSLFGGEMKENCNGTDFSPMFIKQCARQGKKIFLLGSRPGVAEKAAAQLKLTIPYIEIVGARSGYFNDEEEVIAEINRSGAEVLLVGMGAPIQEKWIDQNMDRLNAKVYLGVGALFDWLSGYRQRSPLMMQKMKLEWLWRVMLEPERMAKRYLLDGLTFLGFLFLLRLKALGEGMLGQHIH